MQGVGWGVRSFGIPPSVQLAKQYIVHSRKYPYPPPMEGFLVSTLSPSSGNSSLASYFPLKILAFETPLTLSTSNNLPYGYSLEMHIVSFHVEWQKSTH